MCIIKCLRLVICPNKNLSDKIYVFSSIQEKTYKAKNINNVFALSRLNKTLSSQRYEAHKDKDMFYTLQNHNKTKILLNL